MGSTTIHPYGRSRPGLCEPGVSGRWNVDAENAFITSDAPDELRALADAVELGRTIDWLGARVQMTSRGTVLVTTDLFFLSIARAEQAETLVLALRHAAGCLAMRAVAA